jgi:hypothetical protein
MPAASPTFIVSLHDAHPGSHAAIAAQIAFLGAYGIRCASILVVPEWHHEGPLTRDPAFCDAVSAWQQAGHEIVLHGYFHDRRESPRENLSTLFWTRLYTNREAEFLDLPPETARTRLEQGRKLFTSLGWNASGFVAPAWLMFPQLPALLGELGFTHTTRLTEIVPLKSGAAPVKSQSLCYSTRSGWRPVVSCAWNKRLFGKLRETDLVRLSLHPRDLEFPLIRRQVDQIVRACLKRGFQPATYAEYAAR